MPTENDVYRKIMSIEDRFQVAHDIVNGVFLNDLDDGSVSEAKVRETSMARGGP
jgi:hypothetical protein